MGTIFETEPRTPGAAEGCSEDDPTPRRLVLSLVDVRRLHSGMNQQAISRPISSVPARTNSANWSGHHAGSRSTRLVGSSLPGGPTPN